MDWVNEWWATRVNLRPSSKARDESYLRNHVVPKFGPLPLARISQLEVQSWVAEISHQLAPASVLKAYQLLAKVMQAATNAEMIPASPCHDVELPRVEVEEMRFLTPAEVSALASARTPRFQALVLLGAYGGLRLSEMAGLRRRWIDPLHSTVRVVCQDVEVRGHIVTGPPKTKAGRRTVPLPRQVSEALAAHLAAYCEAEPDALVFQGSQGGQMRAGLWRARHWRPAVAAAGVAPLRIHDLRHTAVAFWIAAGASPKEIATRAGHLSVATVLDRYGHLFPDAVERTTRSLEALYVPPAADADVVKMWCAPGGTDKGSPAT